MKLPLPLTGMVAIFLLGSTTAFAQLPTTITKCYPGPTITVDASGDYGVALPAVDFTTLDFPNGSTITDVDVEIAFNKTDGTCAAPGTGSSFHDETSFRIDSPLGNVILATPSTWSGQTSIDSAVVVFDQSASSIPSNTPVDGTFLPNNGNLNIYNTQNPVGSWNLAAGDNAGGDPLCVQRYCVIITGLIPCNAPTLTLVSSNDVSCWADTNGAAAVSATGGAGGYSYTWSNGATTAAVSNLAGGTYTVTVADQSNCQASMTVTIGEPDTLTMMMSKVDVDCFGDMTGEATSTPVGGTPPFNYAWNSGGTAATETGIGTGFASVVVTDSNGCVATDSIEVTSPDSIAISVDNIVDVTCEGDMDGSISTTTSGGVAPYVIVWDDPNAQGSPTAINLGEGIYAIEVTDANGCIATAVASVGAMFNAPILNVTSPVAANETFADISAPAGFAGYMWSNGANTATTRVFDGGTYTVTVTDDNGCTASGEVVVTDVWPTGFEELSELGDFRFFPNPTQGQVTLQALGFKGSDLNIEVMDLSGRTVYTESITGISGDLNHNLDFSHLAGGPYLLRLHSAGYTGVQRLLLE